MNGERSPADSTIVNVDMLLKREDFADDLSEKKNDFIQATASIATAINTNKDILVSLNDTGTKSCPSLDDTRLISLPPKHKQTNSFDSDITGSSFELHNLNIKIGSSIFNADSLVSDTSRSDDQTIGSNGLNGTVASGDDDDLTAIDDDTSTTSGGYGILTHKKDSASRDSTPMSISEADIPGDHDCLTISITPPCLGLPPTVPVPHHVSYSGGNYATNVPLIYVYV